MNCLSWIHGVTVSTSLIHSHSRSIFLTFTSPWVLPDHITAFLCTASLLHFPLNRYSTVPFLSKLEAQDQTIGPGPFSSLRLSTPKQFWPEYHRQVLDSRHPQTSILFYLHRFILPEGPLANCTSIPITKTVALLLRALWLSTEGKPSFGRRYTGWYLSTSTLASSDTSY